MGIETVMDGLNKLEAEMNQAGINVTKKNFATDVIHFHERLSILESQVSVMTNEVSTQITKIRSHGSALAGAAQFSIPSQLN